MTETLERHILTDSDRTKAVPCKHCGRICVVHVFAPAPRCLSCGGRFRKRKPGGDGSDQLVSSSEALLAEYNELTRQLADEPRTRTPANYRRRDALVNQLTARDNIGVDRTGRLRLKEGA